MTDTVRRPAARGEDALPHYVVSEVRDRRWLESRLSDDRPYSAYALGHLERDLFDWTRFWRAEGPAGEGLVMQARALGSTTMVMGAPEAVAAILALHPGPSRGYLSTAAPEHVEALRCAYDVGEPLQMMRMSLSAATMRDADGPVTRLRGLHARQINALYALEGGPSHYTHDAIEHAIYYGVFVDDRLVSVAGTHIVAPNLSIAVVGNVFTHPEHRGQGYAERVTSAVSRALLDRGCAEVVLTVDPENTPAVSAYRRIGYQPGSAVIEARIRRRDALGVAPALRRWAARRRARAQGEGVEIVSSPLR